MGFNSVLSGAGRGIANTPMLSDDLHPLRKLLLEGQANLATEQAKDYPAQRAFQRRMLESRMLGAEGRDALSMNDALSRQTGLMADVAGIGAGVGSLPGQPTQPGMAEELTEGQTPEQGFESQTGGATDLSRLSGLLNPQRESQGMVAGAAMGVPRPSATPLGQATDPLEAKIRALLPPGVEYKPYDDVARQVIADNAVIAKNAQKTLAEPLMPRVQKRQARLQLELTKIQNHRAVLQSIMRRSKLLGQTMQPQAADAEKVLRAAEAQLQRALAIQQGTQEQAPAFE